MPETELVLAAGEHPINFYAHQIRAANVAGTREDFEQMLRDLVAVCYRGARLIAANPGDWGIDVVVGDLAGQVVIWQAKYFLPVVTADHQNQIRESFSSAMKAAKKHGHQVRKWILCVPASMDAPMDKWWTGWKKRSEKAFDVKIELWHEGELRERLISPDASDVRRHYYDPYLAPVAAKPTRPKVVPVQAENATALETALFIRQLREAGHKQVSSAKLQFFNAELLAREIVDKDVPNEVDSLVEADATVHSIWEATFNEVAELDPDARSLRGLHASVMNQIRDMGDSWPSDLRSTPVHRCGIMHPHCRGRSCRLGHSLGRRGRRTSRQAAAASVDSGTTWRRVRIGRGPHMIAPSSSAHARHRPPVAVPENDTVFRLAQLVLLLHVAAQFHPDGVELERLGAYDFISANPLLMTSSDDDPDRLELIMAGFDDRALSYASPAQRFATRRERLKHDLALLLAYNLATAAAVRGHVLYRPTEAGADMAIRFTAMYARSYTTAATIVVRRLKNIRSGPLRERVTEWTRQPSGPQHIDLADLFAEPDELDETDSFGEGAST